MVRLFPVLILVLLFSSCRKSNGEFLWERSLGQGEALFIKATSDSGFAVCGNLNNKPYFAKFDSEKKKAFEYSSGENGLLSTCWFNTSCYIAGGNKVGRLFLVKVTGGGEVVWEKSFDAGFNIDYTILCYTGGGNLLAVGTASPDSAGAEGTGLLFIRFDTTGVVDIEQEISEPHFISANDAVIDNSGIILLAITRKSPEANTIASVACYNDQFQKIWETELNNNPDFGAASLGIELDDNSNIYVSGKTEITHEEVLVNTSFMASLSASGIIRWKQYLEYSNSGSELVFNDLNQIIMLNRNCLVINILNPGDGSEAGRMLMFEVCDPGNTDAFGSGLDVDHEGNLLVAGSKGGSFYMVLKPVL